MKQYELLDVPKASTRKSKSRDALYDKYKNNRETSLDESLKLYADVKNLSNKDVSFVTVTDHSKNTWNLVVATKNKVVEMRLNLENILVLDIIHLHNHTGDVIYSSLLKSTLKVSKL